MATVAPRFVPTPRITAWAVKLRRWQQQQQQAANLKQQLMHMRIEEMLHLIIKMLINRHLMP
jgi:hypothetical protein